MARHKKTGGGGSRVPLWLITYSDLMTLLLTFFVLLLSMAVIDERTKLVVLGSVSGSFGEGVRLFNPKGKPNDPRVREPGAMDLPEQDLAPLRDMLYEDVEKDLDFMENKYVQILSINDQVLFTPGSTALSPRGEALLDRLMPYLQHIGYPLLVAGHTATLTLSDLVACNKSIVETDGKSYWHYDYADQTPLPGTYTLTFTIPEVSDAGVRTMSTPVEQDGVTLQSIKATPAATKVLLSFPAEQHWVNVRLFTEDGTELGHERGEGGWWTDGAWTADPADFDHPEQCTKASYDYFAAVPENCHSLTVKVYDFDTDAELTTFTAELP